MSKRNALSVSVALAACAFALPVVGEGNFLDIQLTPAGEFRPVDGRVMAVPAWRTSAAIAAKVIERFNARATPPVVDYEHQTLNKESNGQPAPAAAWMRKLHWREGQGIYATVELTQRALEHIDRKEYLFISPVFRFDPATGDVLSIEMAALTNNPAIDGMEPLALRAAATFGAFNQPEESEPMNKLHTAICTALAIAITATEDECIAAATAALNERNALRKSLGMSATATADESVAACSHLVTKTPDPSQYVPLAQFETVKSQLAVLTAKDVGRDVSALVESGLADGRLLPAQKEWATQLGMSNIAALTTYLKDTPAIAALSGRQSKDEPPAANGAHGLSASDLVVCTQLGLTPEAFAAQKKVAA